MENGSFTSNLLSTLVLVFVLVLVIIFFFDDIQLDGVEADDFKTGPTFVARNDIALVCVYINMNIGVAFRASSSRHFLYLR